MNQEMEGRCSMSGGAPHEIRNKKPTKLIFHIEREGGTCGSKYRQVVPVADRGSSSLLTDSIFTSRCCGSRGPHEE